MDGNAKRAKRLYITTAKNKWVLVPKTNSKEPVKNHHSSISTRSSSGSVLSRFETCLRSEGECEDVVRRDSDGGLAQKEEDQGSSTVTSASLLVPSYFIWVLLFSLTKCSSSGSCCSHLASTSSIHPRRSDTRALMILLLVPLLPSCDSPV